MSSGTRISVLRGENFACIRIVGRANFHSSMDFKAVVTRLRERGCGLFVLELSECPVMDSTFLGVLAGLGLQMRQAAANSVTGIELLNPNARITDLLETLGVLHLFKVSHGATPPALQVEPADTCEAQQASKTDLRNTCLEAHKTLMDLNPENIARFKDVARFLAEDAR